MTMVFAGCCTNVVFLEFLVKESPSSVNLITFMQFLALAVVGFVTTADFGRKKPVIPLSYYAKMVLMYFFVQVINNYALNFNISMPLHMIFRSGSLVANLILGIFILKKSYPLSKFVAVGMMTVGICLATIASASQVHKPSKVSGKQEEVADSVSEYVRWCVGVAMLCFALFMSARMGIFQEQTYKVYGKHPDEALFYNHALPLVGFVFLASDIWNHAKLYSSGAPLNLPLVPTSLGITKMWVFLVGNVITQYICIRGVFILTTECASLTVTMVVTLRKFISLLFSIFYFRNPFTTNHWIATVFVFAGSLIFAEMHTQFYNKFFGKDEKDKKRE